MSGVSATDVNVIGAADRINVVGTSGSGKSTFSCRLAEIKGVPYVEMDQLFWKPDWQESSDEEFFARLQNATAADRWVLDGNYHRTRSMKWNRSQVVVYLDLPFVPNMLQLTWRCVKRSVSGDEIWPGTGNRESLAKTFFSSDSVLWWAITHHASNRRRYLATDSFADYPHIHLVHLTSRRQIAACLAAVADLMHEPAQAGGKP